MQSVGAESLWLADHEIQNLAFHVDPFADLFAVHVAGNVGILERGGGDSIFRRIGADLNCSARLASDLDRNLNHIESRVCAVPGRPLLMKDGRRVSGALPQLFGKMRCERRYRNQEAGGS